MAGSTRDSGTESAAEDGVYPGRFGQCMRDFVRIGVRRRGRAVDGEGRAL